MAVELCTDNSTWAISPRISFSHDLNQSETIPIEPQNPLKSSLFDYDFDFCVSSRSYDQESSSADELFANGIILPIKIKKNTNLKSSISSLSSSSSSSSSLLLPPLPPSSVSKTESSIETEDKDKKSFWKFNRSKSLSCCRNICKRGLFPLGLILRSKSIGSTASDNHRHDNVKQSSLNNSNSNSNSNSKSNSTQHQKPPLKKNCRSSFNSGVVRVSPVLNVPTGKLFGLGSIFCIG